MVTMDAKQGYQLVKVRLLLFPSRLAYSPPFARVYALSSCLPSLFLQLIKPKLTLPIHYDGS
jgi:hypothetical protein